MDKIFPRSFPWDWAKTPVRQRMCASHLCAFSREPPLVFCHDTPAPVIAGPEARELLGEVSEPLQQRVVASQQ